MLDLPDGARVAVAMSGGVDSSTVAGLLAEAGFEVLGLTARLYDVDASKERRAGSCCAPDDARDARSVARTLGIRHYVVDEREAFAEAVIEPFRNAWTAAETPNPCVECNRVLKFERLVLQARMLGCAALATGHYARLDRSPDGTPRLRRARDLNKDQAYFLYPMTPKIADYLRFPLGDMSKDEVRSHAARLALPVADKPESMDICFTAGRSPADVVKATAGKLVDVRGMTLGRHQNLAGFTVGQRRGLGLQTPKGATGPLYVLDKQAGGTVVVGEASGLVVRALVIRRYTSVVGPTALLDRAVSVQIRHRGPAIAATVDRVSQDEVLVTIRGELTGAARGQSAVLWADDRVLGGGVIAQATTAINELSDSRGHSQGAGPCAP